MTKISTINNIAKKVKNSVDKQHKLPVIDDYTSAEYGYLLAKSVLNPGKDIEKKKVGKATNPTGTYMSRSIKTKGFKSIAKNVVDFVNNNGRVPNYVQYGNYKIRCRLYIYCFAKIVDFYATKKKLPSYCNFNSAVFYKTKTLSNDDVFNYFVKIFGKVGTIDEALEKVKNRGYGYYFDDKYGNIKAIDRIKAKLGINCTDACQVFWHIAKALGYDVKCIHVKCQSGDGHVRLQVRHKKHTGGNWINRDPAAVLSNNGQPVTYNWCTNGTKIDINPNWFLENVNK